MFMLKIGQNSLFDDRREWRVFVWLCEGGERKFVMKSTKRLTNTPEDHGSLCLQATRFVMGLLSVSIHRSHYLPVTVVFSFLVRCKVLSIYVVIIDVSTYNRQLTN